MTRPRVSLRGLLLLTVAVAGFCWYRDLPRQNANRFTKLIEAGEYDAANAMLIRSGRYPSTWFRGAHWRVNHQQLTLADWSRGRYPIIIKLEMPEGARPERSVRIVSAEASASGILATDSNFIYDELGVVY